jgi:predicted metalloprotease with PDZ domain
MPNPTRYRIAPYDVAAHLFEVRVTVDEPAPDGQRFILPTWIPGSYLVREFARHFVAVRAESPGGSVAVAKEAKDTWRAAPCTGPLSFIAQVYAFDLSVRGAYLDATRAYFNGACVFPCPEGRADVPCEVEIAPPGGRGDGAWRVATTLPRAGAAEWGFGAYRAADYDELIDHPVEMADFALASFEAGGARHDVAITGKIRADLDRLARDLARVCQWQADLFAGGPGGKAPFDRYLFQVAAVGEGYGGLEHRASTSLVCRRDELPAPGGHAMTDGYRNFLGLASHEYFHLWNVKRIKPAAFVPYDLAREAYTRQLWAFEGITSYFDDLALARSGVVEPPSYLELLGRTITTVLRTPGRHVQSAADSSFDAWIKHYRPDENSPNARVSYYAKGAVVALALDLTLRLSGASLDDLMRALWRRFGALGIGIPEDAIPALANELARRDMLGFFGRYVDGTEDPPLAELLADFGVTLHLRPATGDDDRGGKAARSGPRSEGPPRSWLGAMVAGGAEPKLANVYANGPAERAGLAGGDVVVAIDGLRATAASIRRQVEHRAPGERLTIHAFRRDELFAAEVTLAAAPHDTCWLTLATTISGEVRARRDAWLGIAADPGGDAGFPPAQE